MFDIDITKANNSKLQSDILKNKQKLQTNINYNAFYLGIVEDTNDPKGLGRIKARIPAIHGADSSQAIYLDTQSLPWATPALLNGGTNDMGQFIIPIKGSTVVMTFELDSAKDPIYFGTIPSKIGDTKSYNDNANIYNGETYDIDTDDRITDLEEDTAKQIIYKSFKGSTIMIDDKDGKESISIIDAAGQQIIMENNSDTALDRRGNKTEPPKTASIKIISAGEVSIQANSVVIDAKDSITLNTGNFVINADTTNIPDYVPKE